LPVAIFASRYLPDGDICFAILRYKREINTKKFKQHHNHTV